MSGGDHHPSAWGPHDWSHGAPHNSWSPFILSMGVAIFLFSLGHVRMGRIPRLGEHPTDICGLGSSLVQPPSMVEARHELRMHGEVFEPKSTGAPFQNIDIRKVAMWMFLMSEMMVFTALFSTYMRYRLGIPNCKTVFHSGEWVEGTAVTCFEPAGHLIASSWFHIAPGAITRSP